jgi:hypothetical protein
VGYERAHAQRRGQGEGLLVVRFGGRDVRRVTTHGDLAEQPQGPCLIAPHFAVVGVREHPLGQLVGFLHTPNAEISLPTGEGIEVYLRVPSNLPQHGKGVSGSARQGVGQRQMRARYEVKFGMFVS